MNHNFDLLALFPNLRAVRCTFQLVKRASSLPNVHTFIEVRHPPAIAIDSLRHLRQIAPGLRNLTFSCVRFADKELAAFLEEDLLKNLDYVCVTEVHYFDTILVTRLMRCATWLVVLRWNEETREFAQFLLARAGQVEELTKMQGSGWTFWSIEFRQQAVYAPEVTNGSFPFEYPPRA